MTYDELYASLVSKGVTKSGESVKIRNGFFSENDIVNIMSGGYDLGFQVDKVALGELLNSVINKCSQITTQNGFERMIAMFNVIQDEINAYFGTVKTVNREQYYMQNGKELTEDSRICSMSEIKQKGIAECAEKTSVANNLLLLLNQMNMFLYEVSYMNSIVNMPKETGGHAYLGFSKTNKAGEKNYIIYDITNPEIVSYNGTDYLYPAVYSLSSSEYESFLNGIPFDNSHFVMAQYYQPKEKRTYSGFSVEKDELKQAREEYIKMMTDGEDPDYSISDDTFRKEQESITAQSNGIHRR